MGSGPHITGQETVKRTQLGGGSSCNNWLATSEMKRLQFIIYET